MWIKFNSEAAAKECTAQMQLAVDAAYVSGPRVIVMAVKTYDGMWAVPKLAEITHGGVLAESIEPPAIEE